MKPIEINIAIAKILGSPYHKPTEDEVKSGSFYHYEPDYCKDLNLMHSAEEALNHEEGSDFVIMLGSVCGVSKRKDHNFDIVHASALQRAEAFLRTIGKWKSE